MRIDEFIWPEDRIEHIARHGVKPEEVEEVCFGHSWVRRTRSEGQNPVYYVLGQSVTGRYLFLCRDPVSGWQEIPRHGAGDDGERETPIPKVEGPMKTKKPELASIDSIQQLAEFWDAHDLTDFEEQLEDVPEPVFVRGTTIKVPLESCQVDEIEQMAKAKGVSREELIRNWVLQKLGRRNKARPTKH